MGEFLFLKPLFTSNLLQMSLAYAPEIHHPKRHGNHQNDDCSDPNSGDFNPFPSGIALLRKRHYSPENIRKLRCALKNCEEDYFCFEMAPFRGDVSFPRH